MVTNWSEVSAIATGIYGLAMLAFVFQTWRDRVQRERHFKEETANRKLDALRSAFYDAIGYWTGHKPENRSGETEIDAAQSGRVFEALTRLECQLVLNDYKSEAQNLGFAVRTMEGVDEQLAHVGVALGLFPPQYSKVSAVGFKR
jgi:hypothetical protein